MVGFIKICDYEVMNNLILKVQRLTPQTKAKL